MSDPFELVGCRDNNCLSNCCNETRKKLKTLEENYRALAVENKFLIEERDKGIERIKKLEEWHQKSIQQNGYIGCSSESFKPDKYSLVMANMKMKLKAIENAMLICKDCDEFIKIGSNVLYVLDDYNQEKVICSICLKYYEIKND